jgi:N-acetylmuramoyl-L-alanine amidase
MKNPRNIKYIVLHCTASNPNAKISDIQNYWRTQLGWKNPGYHYIIERDGNIIQLLDEKLISNGVLGFNKECINISYIGGIDKDGKPIDNRTDAQKHAMFDKVVELTEQYPQAEVKGHRDFLNQNRACPCFDVKEWLKNYEPDLSDKE